MDKTYYKRKAQSLSRLIVDQKKRIRQARCPQEACCLLDGLNEYYAAQRMAVLRS